MPTTTPPSHRAYLVLGFLLVAPFFATENLQGQDTPIPPSAQPVIGTTSDCLQSAQGTPLQPPGQRTDKMTPQQKSDLTAIAGIRALMGGGVGKRLQGTLPGVDTEQVSHGILADMILAQEQKSTVQTVPLVEPVSSPAKTGNVLDPHMIQTVLRSTAKDLEKLAGQLEQVQFYDKADELRKTATSYWLKARELD